MGGQQSKSNQNSEFDEYHRSVILTEMKALRDLWNKRQKMSQSKLFDQIVPTGQVDFTETYNKNHLKDYFTSDKIVLPIVGGGYNSLHLHRDTLGESKIVLFSNDEFTFVHPLGEPGLHLGLHPSRVTHIMGMCHKKGAVKFNEMLPTNQPETESLNRLIVTMKQVFANLKNNVPVSECGPKVVDRANQLGLPLTTGVRDYFKYLILNFLTPEDKSGRPGYKLLNESGDDVSSNGSEVTRLLKVFDNNKLSEFLAVQPPHENSQMCSHVHGFLLNLDESLPEKIQESYRNLEVIASVKSELADDSESDSDDDMLARQLTVEPKQ
jgi:hypothetical protein